MPMEFISMDLVGRLTKTSSGHEYALTVISMLTGYVFCIPLKTKTGEEIVDKYPCCLHIWEQQKDPVR